jgi:polyhydroxyalkanoate synthesis regulator protein
MEMFAAATPGGKAAPAAPPPADTRAELDDLKAQLAELQQKLNKLAG